MNVPRCFSMYVSRFSPGLAHADHCHLLTIFDIEKPKTEPKSLVYRRFRTFVSRCFLSSTKPVITDDCAWHVPYFALNSCSSWLARAYVLPCFPFGLSHNDQCFCWYLHFGTSDQTVCISFFSSWSCSLWPVHLDAWFLHVLAIKSPSSGQHVIASARMYPVVSSLVLLTATRALCWLFVFCIPLNCAEIMLTSTKSFRFSLYVSSCFPLRLAFR